MLVFILIQVYLVGGCDVPVAVNSTFLQHSRTFFLPFPLSIVMESVPDVSSDIAESDGEARLASLGESEEEYLRASWEKLGVGQDGYLDQTQLALVCECIGMEKLTDEVSIQESHTYQSIINNFSFPYRWSLSCLTNSTWTVMAVSASANSCIYSRTSDQARLSHQTNRRYAPSVLVI